MSSSFQHTGAITRETVASESNTPDRKKNGRQGVRVKKKKKNCSESAPARPRKTVSALLDLTSLLTRVLSDLVLFPRPRTRMHTYLPTL